MVVVLAGASGLIGTALGRALEEQGHTVRRLVRASAVQPKTGNWNPDSGYLNPELLSGAQAVIVLNGASVGRLPWTRNYRNRLITSRLNSTRTIVQALQALANRGENVPLLLSASASGFYGSAPGVELTERSHVGTTFLARLCEAWEAEALQAREITNVALLRTSPVLHPEGVLRPMIRLTQFGLGGRLGSGRQFWPWISLDDEVRAIIHIMDRGLSGPVNLAGPVPATNAEITHLLARELRRPSAIPAPAFLLRAAIGKAATNSLLLCDARVTPCVLKETGFRFSAQTAEEAIHAIRA